MDDVIEHAFEHRTDTDERKSYCDEQQPVALFSTIGPKTLVRNE
nr:hypothetical protein [Halogranum salarium]